MALKIANDHSHRLLVHTEYQDSSIVDHAGVVSLVDAHSDCGGVCHD